MNPYRYFACLLLLGALWPAACSTPDQAELALPDSYPFDLEPTFQGPDLVAWCDDLEAALALSAESGRPVLALYREGGADGLTAMPLLAEAAEDLFVPLMLHEGAENDGAGVRIFDAEENDLVPPAVAVEAPGQLAAMMIGALETGDGEAPEWLLAAAAETVTGERRLLTLAMFCYWEGEAKLGSLDGVLATRSGMMNEDEVVEVVYDPERLAFEQLVESARAMDCASAVYAHTAGDLERARRLVGGDARPAPDRAGLVDEGQVKYALKRTPMAHLPLTPLQATKINADIRLKGDPYRRLSPRQREMLDAVKQLLEQDPTALDDYSPPEKLSLLAEYQARLQTCLE